MGLGALLTTAACVGAGDGRTIPSMADASFDAPQDEVPAAGVDVEAAPRLDARTPPRDTPRDVGRDVHDAADATLEPRGSTVVFDRTAVLMACEGGQSPIRALRPLVNQVLPERSLRFRWRLDAAEGVDGARVQVCADRDCAVVHAQADVAGTAWTPPRGLPPGTWFWRAIALARGRMTDKVTPPRAFRVSAVVGERPCFARFVDFNGDGVDDEILPAGDTRVATEVRHSGPDGIRLLVPPTILHERGFGHWCVGSGECHLLAEGPWVTSIGDVDGDGYADALIGQPTTLHRPWGETVGRWPNLALVRGGPHGLSGPHHPVYSSFVAVDRGLLLSRYGVGDPNDDGFEDWIEVAWNFPRFSCGTRADGWSMIALGDPERCARHTGLRHDWFGAEARCDFTGDGVEDFVARGVDNRSVPYTLTGLDLTPPTRCGGEALRFSSQCERSLEARDPHYFWANDDDHDGYPDVSTTVFVGPSDARRTAVATFAGGPEGFSPERCTLRDAP